MRGGTSGKTMFTMNGNFLIDLYHKKYNTLILEAIFEECVAASETNRQYMLRLRARCLLFQLILLLLNNPEGTDIYNPWRPVCAVAHSRFLVSCLTISTGY